MNESGINKALDRWAEFLRDESCEERWGIALGMHFALSTLVSQMTDAQKERFSSLEYTQEFVAKLINRPAWME